MASHRPAEVQACTFEELVEALTATHTRVRSRLHQLESEHWTLLNRMKVNTLVHVRSQVCSERSSDGTLSHAESDHSVRLITTNEDRRPIIDMDRPLEVRGVKMPSDSVTFDAAEPGHASEAAPVRGTLSKPAVFPGGLRRDFDDAPPDAVVTGWSPRQPWHQPTEQTAHGQVIPKIVAKTDGIDLGPSVSSMVVEELGCGITSDDQSEISNSKDLVQVSTSSSPPLRAVKGSTLEVTRHIRGGVERSAGKKHQPSPLLRNNAINDGFSISREVGTVESWDKWTAFHENEAWRLSRRENVQDVTFARRSRRLSQGLAHRALSKEVVRSPKVVTGEATTETTSCARFVLRPDSLKRILWDLLSVLIVCYDVVQTPLELVFSQDMETSDMKRRVDIIVTVFWTLDMPCCFLTGYHHAGLVEMRPWRIGQNYIRKWFFLDIFIILSDWFFVFLLHQTTFSVVNLVRMAKATRITRMIRAMRILRFAKFYRILSQFFIQIKSEQVRAIFSILVMIACIVFSNHYVACGWYWLGVEQDGHGQTWLTKGVFVNTPILYKYTTALHWSLTQFTPASMDVSATNTAERVYSIVVLLFALVTFTSFVSSITTSMTYLRKIRSEPERQEAILREYFYANKITAELGQRVWNFLWVNHFSIKKRLHEDDISILGLLPDFLRWKIREELYQPVITRLPFLAEYNLWNQTGVQELCHYALQEVSLIAGDELFSRGSWADKTFFITGGTMEYIHSSQNLCGNVREKDCVCEPALWLKWFHCGRLTAKTTTEIAQLDITQFRETLMRYEAGIDFVVNCKRTFHEYMALHPRSDLTSMPLDLVRYVTREARKTLRGTASSRSSMSSEATFSRCSS